MAVKTKIALMWYMKGPTSINVLHGVHWRPQSNSKIRPQGTVLGKVLLLPYFGHLLPCRAIWGHLEWQPNRQRAVCSTYPSVMYHSVSSSLPGGVEFLLLSWNCFLFHYVCESVWAKRSERKGKEVWDGAHREKRLCNRPVLQTLLTLGAGFPHL